MADGSGVKLSVETDYWVIALFLFAFTFVGEPDMHDVLRAYFSGVPLAEIIAMDAVAME